MITEAEIVVHFCKGTYVWRFSPLKIEKKDIAAKSYTLFAVTMRWRYRKDLTTFYNGNH